MTSFVLLRYFKEQKENAKKIRRYVENCSHGDWFILYQMSKNLNRPFFMDFLTSLSRVIEQQKSNPESVANLDEVDGEGGTMNSLLRDLISLVAETSQIHIELQGGPSGCTSFQYKEAYCD